MKSTYTIPAKMSNSGSIHDIADTTDRNIIFGKGCVFAVVLSSYYGGKGYTTHKNESSAIAVSRKLDKNDFSHAIIDVDGNSYNIHPDYWTNKLVKNERSE